MCFIGILKKSSSFRPARSEAEKSPDFRGISLDGAIDGGMSRLLPLKAGCARHDGVFGDLHGVSRSAKGGLDMTVNRWMRST